MMTIRYIQGLQTLKPGYFLGQPPCPSTLTTCPTSWDESQRYPQIKFCHAQGLRTYIQAEQIVRLFLSL